MLFNDMIKKYKPIRIFCPEYGYGWWWKDYFYFIGVGLGSVFAIVPEWTYCSKTEYVFAKGGSIIGDGDPRSWSESRQKELSKLKQQFK